MHHVSEGNHRRDNIKTSVCKVIRLRARNFEIMHINYPHPKTKQ